jgi:hypothetical protein
MNQSDHIKIAIATNDLLLANVHFASAKQIVFYDVGVDSHEFQDCVQFRGGAAFVNGQTRGPGGGLGCAMLFCKGLTDLTAVARAAPTEVIGKGKEAALKIKQVMRTEHR